jgi:hypothetical protein
VGPQEPGDSHERRLPQRLPRDLAHPRMPGRLAALLPWASGASARETGDRMTPKPED